MALCATRPPRRPAPPPQPGRPYLSPSAACGALWGVMVGRALNLWEVSVSDRFNIDYVNARRQAASEKIATLEARARTQADRERVADMKRQEAELREQEDERLEGIYKAKLDAINKALLGKGVTDTPCPECGTNRWVAMLPRGGTAVPVVSGQNARVVGYHPTISMYCEHCGFVKTHIAEVLGIDLGEFDA